MVTEGEDHRSVVLFTKGKMEADKPITVVNLPPVRFIGAPIKLGRTVNIKGERYPDISVTVVTAIGVPVEEALSDIGMNYRRSVIHLYCDCVEDWLRSLEYG